MKRTKLLAVAACMALASRFHFAATHVDGTPVGKTNYAPCPGGYKVPMSDQIDFTNITYEPNPTFDMVPPTPYSTSTIPTAPPHGRWPSTLHSASLRMVSTT